MPTRATRSTSTRSKKKESVQVEEKIEKGNKNTLKETEWNEEQEKQVKKYYTVYQDLPFEDSLHLTAAMLNPSRSPLSIAQKLFQLNLIDEDKLLGHFPELEGKLESSSENKEVEIKAPEKSTAAKKSATSSKSSGEKEVEDILKKITESNGYAESLSILKWLSEKLEEAKFPLEFHQMTIAGGSVKKGSKKTEKESRPLFEILPLEDKEWEYLKNRHVQKLFKALGMDAPKEGGFWSVSEEVSLTFLTFCLSFISFMRKHLEDTERRKKEKEKEERMDAYRKERMDAMKENTMGFLLSEASKKSNTVSAPNPSTEAVKKRTVGVRSPMRTLNPNAAVKKTTISPKKSSLDDIFASPQHKKTRNVSIF